MGNRTGPQDITQDDVRRALRGDRPAATLLVEQLTPVIKARVARVLLTYGKGSQHSRIDSLVEDMTQEIFLHLLERDGRALEAWEPERGLTLDRFVGLIAEREMISRLRRKRRNPWTEEPSPDPVFERSSDARNPEDRATSKDRLRRLLWRFREELSPLGWQIFRLLFIEELSTQEVVRRTGMQRDAIYAWRSRLRRTAHRLAGQLEGEPRLAVAHNEGRS